MAMRILSITAVVLAMIFAPAFARDAMIPEYAPAGSDAANNPSVFWNQNSRDGYLTREQVVRYGARDFAKVDADNDGRVSLREWNAWHVQAPRSQPSFGDSEWTRFDSNRDGFISKREAKEMDPGTWTYADLNADGKISLKEWRAVSSIAGKRASPGRSARADRADWERMDLNQDGWISRREALEVDSHTFARLDADGDGKLSQEEWSLAGSLPLPGAAGRTAPPPAGRRFE
jgi:Ca2+-binding EF-hand superfamily protein